MLLLANKTNQAASKSSAKALTAKPKYNKYKSQNKTNFLLHKLEEDAGYPQPILNHSDPFFSTRHSFHSTVDHISENKKNLKNFFKERIPDQLLTNQAHKKNEANDLNLVKMFEMKRREMELKNHTKIFLNRTIHIETNKQANANKLDFENNDKFDEYFIVHDKTKELKELYRAQDIQNNSMVIPSNHQKQFIHHSQNHRKGTKSHIEKRTILQKKVAYDQVFGPDISSLCRESLRRDKQKIFQKDSKEVIKRKSATQVIKKRSSDTDKDHNYLSSLIENLNKYKNAFEDESSPEHTQSYKKETLQKDQDGRMLTLIQNISKFYKGVAVETRPKVKAVEDLAKIDFKFYQELQKHKKHRLNSKINWIGKNASTLPYEYSLQPSFMAEGHQTNYKQQNLSVLSSQIDQQDFSDEVNKKAANSKSIKQKFILLKVALVRWALMLSIFDVEKQYIFDAFRAEKCPYELEGSYAFFKYVKMGDLRSVQEFISRNRLFLFQIEFQGKSALSYACYHNQTSMALYLIEQGMNLNQCCLAQKTCLFYAINNKNVELVRRILQGGASPWSTATNPYSKLVGDLEQKWMANLLGNAKKVYLGMQLQKTIRNKTKFWNDKKGLIQEHSQLAYGAQLFQ